MADDLELSERVCRKDAHAFEAFYRQNAPHLRGFLVQLLGSSQAAEDVTQETFLHFWNRLNGFRPNGSLRAYLFGIARRQAAEWWRQRGPVPELTCADTEPPKAEASALVEDAFARLGADRRSLLWLREVEGQSYAELAEILEIPVGTVRSRLSAARQELRQIWQADRGVNKEGA